MEEKKSASDAPYQIGEAQMLEMKKFLEIIGDRIEVLECLDTYAYFFPDWLMKITEGLQSLITCKQANNIPCDEEKEILSNARYFFTKIAYFSGLISEWHRNERRKRSNGRSVEPLFSRLRLMEKIGRNFFHLVNVMLLPERGYACVCHRQCFFLRQHDIPGYHLVGVYRNTAWAFPSESKRSTSSLSSA
jgi:hypothetical protein